MVKIIKNGRVIDPESRFDGRADLWIENGKIQKNREKDTKAESDGASDAPSIPAEAEVLDAEGLIVAPGLVDVHVHFRDPGLTYKEDIETGAAAAKAGGFTTVVCMANTKPVADTPEIVRYILEKGAKTGIHVETCAAVSKGFQGKELTDMDALKEAGAIGFTDDGIPLMSEKLVKEAMEDGETPQCARSASMKRIRHLFSTTASTAVRCPSSWESAVPRRWRRIRWWRATA